MSARRFPDFFQAYRELLYDNFVPNQFNDWSCLSIVAAALERKVWLRWSDSWACYPNIYVMMVAGPGEGKTQALSNAVDLLEQANRKLGGTVNVLPNQATEAAFIKLLGHGRTFQLGTQIIFQNAAYYRAAEASASLRNIYGEFLACLTDLYDCPNKWARATVKDGITPIELKNVCINLLAATTFDYLGELVNDRNIQGGFASRLIYVLSKNKEVVAQQFQNGGITEVSQRERDTYRGALVEDLMSIHRMAGPMTADTEFKTAWEAWWLESETKRKAYGSEKLQSLLVRANLHMLKTSMILSACESDERVLHKRHWDRALALVAPAMANIPEIFRESRAANVAKGQKNITHAVFHALMQGAEVTQTQLRGRLIAAGARSQEVDAVMGALVSTGDIRLGVGGRLEVLGNPDDHL